MTIIKQPNGKYCIYEFIGNKKRMNLNYDEVFNTLLDMAKNQIKEDIERAKHFSFLVKRKLVTDSELKQMGEDRPLAELLKFVPTSPVNQTYAGRDCTTYGKCPTCGKTVQNGMGLSEIKCSNCNQMLKW